MKLLGFEIRRINKTLSPPSSGRWFTIHDQYPGAWQQDNSIELDSVLTFSAVFACVRLISTDIGKLGVKLMELQASGIRLETSSASFSPVLRKQNHYQTRIKFFEQWIVSKLLHGNTYILKGRDSRGIVNRLFVLDPTRVQPLVSDSGEVFYRLSQDNIVGLHNAQITIPATEIIHDVHVTPHHPLIGMSPIAAAGLAAMQGLKIQNNSEKFFANMSRPGGLLIAPGRISEEQAKLLKAEFNTNYGGENVGKIAVISDGMTFKETTMSATDAQLIEQLKFTGELVCTAFGVPAYKVGIGQMPTHNNMAALNQLYYDDTLQELIECVELLLDEGMELPEKLSVHFDLEDLLRMDATSRNAAYESAVKSGWKAPNEVRIKENMIPVAGGNTPYLQVQNYSLAALKHRDMKDQRDETDVQAAAMNGAQVTSLQGILAAVASGEMPPETAAAAIAAAFPLLTSEQIQAMVGPLAGFSKPTNEVPSTAEQTPDPAENSERALRLLNMRRAETLTDVRH